MKDLCLQTPFACFKHAALDVSEAREVHLGEFFQRTLHGVEPPFDLGGRLSQGRGVLVQGLWLGRQRVPQKGLSCDAVLGGAVRRHEGLRLPGTQRMASDRVGQALLLRRTEGGQSQRHGQSETPLVQPMAQLRTEAPSQQEPSLDPGLLSSQELRDRPGREAILVRKRGHHPDLVHGARGLAGSVGLQESCLHGDAGNGLQDHGDLPSAFGSPPGQAFESVEDLEGPLLDFRDPKGQWRKVGLVIRALAPQRSEIHAETIEGDLNDQLHREDSSKGRIWYKG